MLENLENLERFEVDIDIDGNGKSWHTKRHAETKNQVKRCCLCLCRVRKGLSIRMTWATKKHANARTRTRNTRTDR